MLLVLICSFSLTAFADIIESEDKDANQILSSDILSNEEDSTVTNLQKILLDTLSNSDANINDSVSDSSVSAQVYSLRISPNDTNGLKAILLSLMGDYEPIVTDYTYRQGSSSYESHSIDIQPDFVWLSSFVIFALIIYCLFRLGGAMFG